MKYVYYFLIALSLSLLACRKGKEMKTDAGFKYVLYTESTGLKPKIGDYVTLIMSYKNVNDSVLFDWKKSGTPIRFQLEKIPFKGSFEDGITYLAENDSATFFVPADSLYKYYYSKTGTPQSETAFITGSFLEFSIRLLKVQDQAQAEEEMLLKQSAEERQEEADIKSYIEKHNITVEPDSSGYYLIIKEKSNGNLIDSGKVITINYEGRFLNDSVFEGSKLSEKPFQFIFGAHRVILGWEIALKNLNSGDKITLVVPSKLAYGIQGLREMSSPNWVVAPNTPLVFDIEILDVEDVPSVTGT